MDSLNDMTLAQLDPEIQAVLDSELERQRGTLEMIASENFVPRAVLQAQGSVLTNKYAEGYPGRRYYGGCEFVDVAESLAIERAKQVFGGDYVNVQPHAGAQANAAALMAMANVGDPILGLSLAHGGHLTHGMRLNFSGKHYKAVAYEVDRETMRIEPEKVREAALAERPRVIIAGWSAYPRHLDFQAFRDIADEVGAALWVDMAHFAGLVAAGLHPNPVPYADVVTTTVHKTLGGPRSGMILSSRGEQWGKKLNSAVFPGQQGGPLMHVIAAKAIAMKVAQTEEFKDRQRRTLEARRSWPSAWAPTTPRMPASSWSPAAPTSTWSWSTWSSPSSTASRPRICCTRSVLRSTATRCPSTRVRRPSPRACASARPPWPRADSTPRTSRRSRTSSARR